MLKMITKLVLKWCSIVIFAQNEEVSKGFNLRENEKVWESKIFFSNNVENDFWFENGTESLNLKKSEKSR